MMHDMFFSAQKKTKRGRCRLPDYKQYHASSKKKYHAVRKNPITSDSALIFVIS
jgi:hypothetical protein